MPPNHEVGAIAETNYYYIANAEYRTISLGLLMLKALLLKLMPWAPDGGAAGSLCPSYLVLELELPIDGTKRSRPRRQPGVTMMDALNDQHHRVPPLRG